MSENTINEDLNNEISENQETASENMVTEKSEVEILKEELQKEKDQYLRLFAEFDNFKKRTSKERFDIFKTANAEVISALIPVLDDFERGMKEIEKSENNELFTGIQLIHNKLNETLRAKGLKPVEVNAGDDFDTDKHEAITQIPAPTEDLKGKIVDVVETGYALNDKIIRFAKVVIGQ
ncbi:nucleotide exchange factor GrpE [Moheibacter sediminis]|uniref:Protein GrpE n=1 Tax=Moheibacter sediminis TaxID=1434700 RepID=A0A1W1ZQC5_9FLAO|nr:nucleotide exchange factor GrpE [Moheibacter sediminis]SMC50567.1 molecular chaperone GrpE [Moheibacter sediminis]